MMARRPSLLSAEMAAGGHDKMFVLPPPSELVCKSCDLIAKNPCKTQCDCRGVYCSGCVADLQGKCPTCEKLVQPTNDLVSAHRIFTLPVKCDNAENGCVWIGDLGQLDSHILACPKQQIHCPYHMLGCRKQLPRGELDTHNESCVHKHLRLAVLRLERLESKIHVPPLVFQLTDFNRRLQLNHEWHSAPFYTHPTGYRMCLRVNARGDGVGRGTHVSLYVCLMQGCNDDGLAWPFRGEVTLELLNQLQDNGHKQETIHFTKYSHYLHVHCVYVEVYLLASFFLPSHLSLKHA